MNNTVLSKLKVYMARRGYYIVSEYAPLIGVTKQAVSKSLDTKKYPYVFEYNRKWYKYDGGQHSKVLYPNESKLKKLYEYNFNHRHNNLVVSNNTICDIKYLNKKGDVAINFYSENGDMISFLSNIHKAEIITNNLND